MAKYTATPEGILKIVEIILILVMTFLFSYHGWSFYTTSKVIMSAAIVGFIVSIGLLICGVNNVAQILLKFQFVAHFIMFLWFLVASSYWLAKTTIQLDSQTTAVVFGIIISVVYLVDGIMSLFKRKPLES